VVRFGGAILIGLAGLLSQVTQPSTHTEALPSVSILLPPSVPSDTVQVSYFLVGPFGGDGTFVATRAGVQAYEIPTRVDGKAATEVKAIVFATGCEFQTFVIPLGADSRVREEFSCQPVKSARLSGQIVPNELARDDNAEIVVSYVAYWTHEFYGVADGPVTEFRLPVISPDINGRFQVDLPYFSADAAAPESERRAGFRLTLRDSKTWNPIVSSLEAEVPELNLEEGTLRIQSHYPADLKFTGRNY